MRCISGRFKGTGHEPSPAGAGAGAGAPAAGSGAPGALVSDHWDSGSPRACCGFLPRPAVQRPAWFPREVEVSACTLCRVGTEQTSRRKRQPPKQGRPRWPAVAAQLLPYTKLPCGPLAEQALFLGGGHPGRPSGACGEGQLAGRQGTAARDHPGPERAGRRPEGPQRRGAHPRGGTGLQESEEPIELSEAPGAATPTLQRWRARQGWALGVTQLANGQVRS